MIDYEEALIECNALTNLDKDLCLPQQAIFEPKYDEAIQVITDQLARNAFRLNESENMGSAMLGADGFGVVNMTLA